MVYVICFLAEAKQIDEARRRSLRFFDENQPGHAERLEGMLPIPLYRVKTGELTLKPPIGGDRFTNYRRPARLVSANEECRPRWGLFTLRGPDPIPPAYADGMRLPH